MEFRRSISTLSQKLKGRLANPSFHIPAFVKFKNQEIGASELTSKPEGGDRRRCCGLAFEAGGYTALDDCLGGGERDLDLSESEVKSSRMAFPFLSDDCRFFEAGASEEGADRLGAMVILGFEVLEEETIRSFEKQRADESKEHEGKL